MDSQLKRGIIDYVVLAALKHEDSYGYKIIQDISEIMDVTESTLYPVLRRLKKQGYLTTRNVMHQSRVRKYYSLTDAGRHRLNEAAGDFRVLRDIYEYIVR